jgi:hypothetical protein
MTDRETRNNLRDSIKELVEQKVAYTRDRRAYKLRTRPLLQTGEITEAERRKVFSEFDDMRHDLKHDIRYGLLLYGYLRGRDYKQIERRCAKHNKPSASAISLFADEFAEGLQLSQSAIKRWLEGEASPHKMPRRAGEAEAA